MSLSDSIEDRDGVEKEAESTNWGHFDQLFAKNVPHILENIFLSLDYESFKNCLRVNRTWNGLLTSETFQIRAKIVFQAELFKYERALWRVSKNGKIDKVRKLLSNRLLNVSRMHDTEFESKQSKHRAGLPWNTTSTALYEAANRGHTEIVQLLLQAGADPDKSNNLGWTPLHAAVANNHRDVAKLLLENGADPHVADDYDGWTPLHTATHYGQMIMVQLLLDGGADPHKASKTGRTPVSIAAEFSCAGDLSRILNAQKK